jgi:hypothetical protein
MPRPHQPTHGALMDGDGLLAALNSSVARFAAAPVIAKWRAQQPKRQLKLGKTICTRATVNPARTFAAGETTQQSP